MAVLWVVILVACIIIEVLTVALVSIWFAVAAGLALCALALGAGTTVQVIIFIIASAIGMILFKKIWKSKLKDKKIPTNFDRYIGNEFTVVETIDTLAGKGAVSISGQIWTAKNVNEKEIIEKGSIVTLVIIEGSLAYVQSK